MTTSYGFQWSWIDSISSTKRASGVVQLDGGVVYSFRQPHHGAVSSTDLVSFSKSVGKSLQDVRSNWRTYTRPILDSLPAGGIDTRWSSDTGQGLPAKIDCFTYGVQGCTLFVFNDATSTKADGRYWISDEYRPKTIAEAFEDLWEAISEVTATITDPGEIDLDPLWAAIGEEYRDGFKVGTHGSLDTRVGTLETYINQLDVDIYEPETYSYHIGTPLLYSIAKNIDELLQIHNVTGWQSDPSDVSHDGVVSVPSHTHAFTEVLPPPSNSETQERAGPYTNLSNEVKRLRWEIQRTRGSSSWYSDVTSPFAATPVATLGDHVNYVGGGTATESNPHGANCSNVDDLVDRLDAIVSFTGMSSYTDANPTYASTNYVTQSASLETAIGELDDAISSAISTTVQRLDYDSDRSSMSETDRANTPIVINHNLGRKPIVEVLDMSPSDYGSYGEYSSPATELGIVHIDSNSFQIWTTAAVVEIIVIG